MGQHLNFGSAAPVNVRLGSGFQSHPEEYFVPRCRTTKSRPAILGQTIIPRRPWPPPPRRYGVRYQVSMWLVALILILLLNYDI